VEDAEKAADLAYLAEEIPKAITQSLEGVGRVSDIVRAMKDFSHPGASGKEAIDLSKAIESTVTVARNEWKYVADMVTDFDPALPPVPCLVGEFNQVILNIVVNAAHAIADVIGDHTDKRGTIRITTRRDNKWAEIRISDTGTGIPEQHRSRVFDHFFTTKAVGKGTGQGLSIAHAVVTEKHGGSIALETEMGKGTTFIIRLPIEPESARKIVRHEEMHSVC
jgi:signal transduction histidine kinase